MMRIFLVAIAALLLGSTAQAQMSIEGDTLLFKRPRGERGWIERVHRFENRFQIPSRTIQVAGPEASSLVQVLKRRVKQGITFAVDAHKRHAVIMSYFCTMEECGAEFPYVCQARIMVADAKGRKVEGTSVEGNYQAVKFNRAGTHFALLRPVCCTADAPADIYDLKGTKSCSLKDIPGDWETRSGGACQ